MTDSAHAVPEPPSFSAEPRDLESIRLIRQLRPDLCGLFPLREDVDWLPFLNWLVFSGLGEYRLLAEDDRFRSYLLAVEPGDDINRLMRLLHTRMPELRERFPLPEERTAFEEWFFSRGGQQLGFGPLLSAGDRSVIRPTHADRPFGVNLVGHVHAQLGIAEDVRMMAQACLAAGIPFSILDFPPGPDVTLNDFTLTDRVTTDGPHPVNVFCLAAPEQARFVAERGMGQLAGRYNIGYWPWELSQWPQEWQPFFAFVDEVWVSSRHARSAIEPTCPVPVVHMPMAVEIGEVGGKGRSHFGLPEDAVLFCFAFDHRSSIHRKNPMACLEAFQRAFPARAGGGGSEDGGVGLVIKSNQTWQPSLEWQWILRAAESDPRVRIIEDDLPRSDVLALYRCCDAFLSLHRAEGFGRCIAEAIQLDLHVITTGYSGNVDFCDRPEVALVDHRLVEVEEGQYPCGAGQVWAEPNVAHAAELMQRFARRARHWPRGSTRTDHSHRGGNEWPEFSAAVVGRRYERRLRQLWEQQSV